MKRTTTLAEVRVYVKVMVDYQAMWSDRNEKTIKKLSQLLICEEHINECIESDLDDIEGYEGFKDVCLQTWGDHIGSDPNLTPYEYALCSWYLSCVDDILDDTWSGYDDDEIETKREEAISILR